MASSYDVGREDKRQKKIADALAREGVTVNGKDIPLPSRELEALADELLAKAGDGGEHPYYSAATLVEKCKKERKIVSEEREAISSHYVSSYDEAKSLLIYLAKVSSLARGESLVLSLILDGWTHREISAISGISLLALKYTLSRLRKKLVSEVSPSFFHSCHVVRVYRKPSLCCNYGKEECKNDQGRCPYHRSVVPR